jgi:hypothetical protein
MMTEHRAKYKAGKTTITPGAGNELHRGTSKYKVLLKPEVCFND